MKETDPRQLQRIKIVDDLHAEITGDALGVITKAVKLGKMLKLIKKDVGHGNWEEYVDDNLTISDRQAQKYLRVFENQQKVLDAAQQGLIEGVTSADDYLSNRPSRADLREETAQNDEPVTVEATVERVPDGEQEPVPEREMDPPPAPNPTRITKADAANAVDYFEALEPVATQIEYSQMGLAKMRNGRGMMPSALNYFRINLGLFRTYVDSWKPENRKPCPICNGTKNVASGDGTGPNVTCNNCIDGKVGWYKELKEAGLE